MMAENIGNLKEKSESKNISERHLMIEVTKET